MAAEVPADAYSQAAHAGVGQATWRPNLTKDLAWHLGYKLGYKVSPDIGIAHPIAVPASAKEVNSIPRRLGLWGE